MDAIKAWWTAKGKAYAMRALHASWQSAIGFAAGYIDVLLSGSLSGKSFAFGILSATIASLIKSLSVGTPETREGKE